MNVFFKNILFKKKFVVCPILSFYLVRLTTRMFFSDDDFNIIRCDMFLIDGQNIDIRTSCLCFVKPGI